MNWKKIKMIHVSKYVFYNSLIAFVLLAVSGRQVILQMKITLGIMVILGLVVVIKVFCGIIYLIKYKGCSERP